MASSLVLVAVPFWYGIWSLIAVIAYGIDKSAARKGRWRISENTLHVLALLGGWPGAWFASELFRHKSRKASFRRMFWGTAVANVLAGLLLVKVWAA